MQKGQPAQRAQNEETSSRDLLAEAASVSMAGRKSSDRRRGPGLAEGRRLSYSELVAADLSCMCRRRRVRCERSQRIQGMGLAGAGVDIPAR